MNTDKNTGITGRVTVSAAHGSYDVVIGKKLDIGKLLRDLKGSGHGPGDQASFKACKILLVSDDTVDGLYGERTRTSLEAAGFEVQSFVFPHGEASKNIGTLSQILEYAADHAFTKTDMFAALGGGVVGDITGFASAVYLRGTDYIQIPTTILAAVDSSVGGKTAVDLGAGKNLAGAFHQPVGVFLDTETFDTLPKAIASEGIAEAVKYGMIRDESLLEEFEKDDPDLDEICRRCIQIKADVVHVDEFDTGLRKILNFGHTPAHSIEKLSGFKIPHGNAVAIGMVIMTKLSKKLGRLSGSGYDACERLLDILKRYDLPTVSPYSATELAKAAGVDKKRTGDSIDLVLLGKVGEAVIEKYPVSEIEGLFRDGME